MRNRSNPNQSLHYRALAASLMVVCLVFGAVAGSAALGQEIQTTRVPRAADPAEEIYNVNEARRQNNIARQLELNQRLISGSGYGSVFYDPFDPWPRVPGGIYRYSLLRRSIAQPPVAQPIGHESIQTGPNRWIYRPVYPTPAQPAVMMPSGGRAVATVAPPAARVQLPGPSDLSEPPLPKTIRRGPRQF